MNSSDVFEIVRPTPRRDAIAVSPAAPCGRRPSPILQRLQERMAAEFLPRWEHEWGGRPIVVGMPAGPDAVRLDGNDYLGLSGHPEVVEAQVRALTRNQASIVQSRIFQSDEDAGARLERALARWLGHDSAVLCQSGYAANLGLLQVVADPGMPVYADSLAHMSIWEGIRVSGATAHAFRHNDPGHLERLVQRHGPGLVVVDSVYSTTGALCPLRAVVEVAEASGSLVMVDESHSLGTHGPQGRGLCVALGLEQRVHFITASLAKAFAGRAGFFTAPESLRCFLLSQNFPTIFSSSLQPHDVAGLAATLDVIRRSDDARERLVANTRRLRASLSAMGYPIAHGSEQIIALEAGPEAATRKLREAMEQRGVVGAVFCAPATARNRSMVRLTLSSLLTQAELEHVESALGEVAQLLRPWEWPIARRQRTGQD